MGHAALARNLGVVAAMCTAGMLAAVTLPSRAVAATVEVTVMGVRNVRGHVRVQLCTRETFLTKACPYQESAPAQIGATILRFADVAPGVYAAQAFHDETDQGVVHQGLFGIPRERLGFSNDAPVHFHAPRFKDAAFEVGPDAETITLRLRRFFPGG
jgi:uncharacterized protein (DUF2141 family)